MFILNVTKKNFDKVMGLIERKNKTAIWNLCTSFIVKPTQFSKLKNFEILKEILIQDKVIAIHIVKNEVAHREEITWCAQEHVLESILIEIKCEKAEIMDADRYIAELQ